MFTYISIICQNCFGLPCALDTSLTPLYSLPQATLHTDSQGTLKTHSPVHRWRCSGEGTEETEEMGQRERRETHRHVDRRETKDQWDPQGHRGPWDYLGLKVKGGFLVPREQLGREDSVAPLACLDLKNRDLRAHPQEELPTFAGGTYPAPGPRTLS